MINGLIFDWNGTLYDSKRDYFLDGSIDLFTELSRKGYQKSLLVDSSDFNLDSVGKPVLPYGFEIYFSHIQPVSDFKKISDLKTCAEAMNLRYRTIAVVGDRVRTDVSSAKKLGMKTIWYRDGYFKDEMPRELFEFPDFVIYNLEDVISSIERL